MLNKSIKEKGSFYAALSCKNYPLMDEKISLQNVIKILTTKRKNLN
jgi:hypothetical protein